MRRATDDEIRELRELWVNNETLDRVLAELRSLRRSVKSASEEEREAFAAYRDAVRDLSVTRAIPVFDADAASRRWRKILSCEARVASTLATLNLRIAESVAEEMTQ